MHVRDLYTRHYEKHDDYIFNSTFVNSVCMCGDNCDISSVTPRNGRLSPSFLWRQRRLGWLGASRCLYYKFWLQAIKIVFGQLSRIGNLSESWVVEPGLVTSQHPGSRSWWTVSLGLSSWWRTCSSSFWHYCDCNKNPRRESKGQSVGHMVAPWQGMSRNFDSLTKTLHSEDRGQFPKGDWNAGTQQGNLTPPHAGFT